MSRTLALAFAVLAASTAGALAHSNSQHRHDQQSAIELGRQDGSITWREGRRLRRELAEIARVERAFLADGHLSGQERRILREMRRDADALIAAEANDNYHRWSILPRVGR
jgi:hypothetical protein